MSDLNRPPEFPSGQSLDAPPTPAPGLGEDLPLPLDVPAAPDTPSAAYPDITAPAERGADSHTREDAADVGRVASTDVAVEVDDTVQLAEGPRLPLESQRAVALIDAYRPEGDVKFEWSTEDSYLYLQYRRPEIPPEEMCDPDIGGVGVTARNMERLESVLPGVTEELMQEPGKIVILGSGLSTAPLDILDQRGPDNQPEDLVLLDAMDYAALKADLDGLRDVLEQHLIEQPPSLTTYREKCDALLAAAEGGKVKLVQHVVGAGEMPAAAREASLVVNTFGPPEHTLRDQLDALAPGGRLYASGFSVPGEVVEDIDITEIIEGDALKGHIIKRRPAA
jgi:hypothetical protein